MSYKATFSALSYAFRIIFFSFMRHLLPFLRHVLPFTHISRVSSCLMHWKAQPVTVPPMILHHLLFSIPSVLDLLPGKALDYSVCSLFVFVWDHSEISASSWKAWHSLSSITYCQPACNPGEMFESMSEIAKPDSTKMMEASWLLLIQLAYYSILVHLFSIAQRTSERWWHTFWFSRVFSYFTFYRVQLGSQWCVL